MKWNIQTGTIGININLSENASTRKGLLSTLTSIYDPPGWEAPIFLKGQLILQQHCGSKLNWNEVTENSAYEWLKCKICNSFITMENISIPRC